MKRNIIIIFIIILGIHLVALAYFISLNHKDKESGSSNLPSKELPQDKLPVRKDVIPEPVLVSDVAPPAKPKLNKPKPSYTPKKHAPSTSFYKYRPIPHFDFTDAAMGNLSKVPETKGAKAGILVDLDNGRVIWAKNASKPVAIASMTKIMTALIAYEYLRDKKISYSTPVKVTKSAAAIGGSEIWIDVRETFPFRDLLKAMLIKSANDAAFLVAEKLGNGNVKNFVNMMNKKASDMGCRSAKFFNPNGLPGKSAVYDNRASCTALAIFAAHLLCYPDALKLTSTKTTTIPRHVGKVKKTILTNTNHLVRSGISGVDGLKTGYTNRAGSCLTFTCKRKGRRLIGVLAGFKHRVDRDKCAIKLLDWGYKQ